MLFVPASAEFVLPCPGSGRVTWHRAEVVPARSRRCETLNECFFKSSLLIARNYFAELVQNARSEACTRCYWSNDQERSASAVFFVAPSIQTTDLFVKFCGGTYPRPVCWEALRTSAMTTGAAPEVRCRLETGSTSLTTRHRSRTS